MFERYCNNINGIWYYGLKRDGVIIIEANKYSYLDINEKYLFKNKKFLIASIDKYFGIIDFNENILLDFKFTNFITMYKFGYIGVTISDPHSNYNIMNLKGEILKPNYDLTYDEIANHEFIINNMKIYERNLKLNFII
jgi:hypothetical protein